MSQMTRYPFGQLGHHIHDDPPIHYKLKSLRTAQWKFNQDNLLTDFVGSFTLTNSGSVGQSTSDFQEGNASARYGGGNDRFELASTEEFFGNQDYSLSLWVNLGNSNSQSIFSKDNSTTRREYNLLIGSNQFVVVIGNGVSITSVWSSGVTVLPGIWYHLILTHDVSEKRVILYINNMNRLERTYSLNTGSSTEAVRLGSDGRGGGFSLVNNSKLDNVIWFRGTVLNEEQVNHLFNHPNFH